MPYWNQGTSYESRVDSSKIAIRIKNLHPWQSILALSHITSNISFHSEPPRMCFHVLIYFGATRVYGIWRSLCSLEIFFQIFSLLGTHNLPQNRQTPLESILKSSLAVGLHRFLFHIQFLFFSNPIQQDWLYSKSRKFYQETGCNNLQLSPFLVAPLGSWSTMLGFSWIFDLAYPLPYFPSQGDTKWWRRSPSIALTIYPTSYSISSR